MSKGHTNQGKCNHEYKKALIGQKCRPLGCGDKRQ